MPEATIDVKLDCEEFRTLVAELRGLIDDGRAVFDGIPWPTGTTFVAASIHLSELQDGEIALKVWHHGLPVVQKFGDIPRLTLDELEQVIIEEEGRLKSMCLDVLQSTKTQCTCPTATLMTSGCTCGAMKKGA